MRNISPCSAVVLLCLFAAAAIACPPAPEQLEVIETGDGWVRLQWEGCGDPSVIGYRIRCSSCPGSHPIQPDWNGSPAAFTFSTDDGWKDKPNYTQSNRVPWELRNEAARLVAALAKKP